MTPIVWREERRAAQKECVAPLSCSSEVRTCLAVRDTKTMVALPRLIAPAAREEGEPDGLPLTLVGWLGTSVRVVAWVASSLAVG